MRASTPIRALVAQDITASRSPVQARVAGMAPRVMRTARSKKLRKAAFTASIPGMPNTALELKRRSKAR